MKHPLTALFCIALCSFSIAQRSTLDILENQIARLDDHSGGQIGVGIHHLESGLELIYHEGVPFPMASTYKIPIAIKLLQRVEAGELTLDSLITIQASDLHPGSGTLTTLFDDPGVILSVRNLMELMMLISDNSATDLCFKLAGRAEGINSMLAEAQISNISVDRPTSILIGEWLGVDIEDPDGNITMDEFMAKLGAVSDEDQDRAKDAFSANIQDQSTPEAMVKTLKMLWSGELLNDQHTHLLLDIMYRCQTGNNRLKGMLPPDTPVAHKTGTIGGTTNDVGIVDLPDEQGHVIVVCFVKDSSIEIPDREKIIAHVARAAYDYFLFKK